jgi:hypothetical protein
MTGRDRLLPQTEPIRQKYHSKSWVGAWNKVYWPRFRTNPMCSILAIEKCCRVHMQHMDYDI